MGSHKNGAKLKYKQYKKDSGFTKGENKRYAAFDSTMEQVGTEQKNIVAGQS